MKYFDSFSHELTDLCKLALKYSQTDKYSIHKYTPFYSHYFDKIRKDVKHFLEIGIAQGDSLKMWAEYFPNAIIYGIDIEDRSYLNTDRIKTFVGDQMNANEFLNLFKDITFDIIIDDGGHSMKMQQTTFDILFDLVNPNGYYIIEDLHTSFIPCYLTDKDWSITTYDLVCKLQNKLHIDCSYIDTQKLDKIRNKIDLVDIFQRNKDLFTESITSIIHKRNFKIAIEMSGFLRTWNNIKLNFKNVLCKNIVPDLFIHTYKQNLYQGQSGVNDEDYSDAEIKEMFSDFNVAGLVIEDRYETNRILLQECEKWHNVPFFTYFSDPESSDKKNTTRVMQGPRIIDQSRKMDLCHQLQKQYSKENNIEYDFVIRTRFDLMYLNSIDWNKLYSMCNNKNIFLGYGCVGGSPDDTFAIGLPSTMNIYCERLVHLDDIFKSGVRCCAHQILKALLDNNNIKIEEKPIVHTRFARNPSQYWNASINDLRHFKIESNGNVILC